MRNRRFVLLGEARRKSHSTATMTKNARPKPMSGEKIIGRTTLSTIALP